MGAWIVAQGLTPGEVLCSDAARTRETLDLMLEGWSPAPRVALVPALYHASPEAMLAAIEGSTAPVVALVGHNPGIGQLARRLARRAPDHPRWQDYPTCATTALRFEVTHWPLLREGQGEVLSFAVPDDI